MDTDRSPVDVICVCSADGEIRPLRPRFQDEQKQLLRVNMSARRRSSMWVWKR